MFFINNSRVGYQFNSLYHPQQKNKSKRTPTYPWSIPLEHIPKAPNERNSFINCWLGVVLGCSRGMLEKFLDQKGVSIPNPCRHPGCHQTRARAVGLRGYDWTPPQKKMMLLKIPNEPQEVYIWMFGAITITVRLRISDYRPSNGFGWIFTCFLQGCGRVLKMTPGLWGVFGSLGYLQYNP